MKAKKNVIRHVTSEFQRVYKAKDENLNYEKELNAQLSKLQKMRQKYMDMYTDDLITREELNEKIGGTKQEIERLEKEIADQRAETKTSDETITAEIDRIKNLINFTVGGNA